MDNYALANVLMPANEAAERQKVQPKGQIEFAVRLKGFNAFYECKRACECIGYQAVCLMNAVERLSQNN